MFTLSLGEGVAWAESRPKSVESEIAQFSSAKNTQETRHAPPQSTQARTHSLTHSLTPQSTVHSEVSLQCAVYSRSHVVQPCRLSAVGGRSFAALVLPQSLSVRPLRTLTYWRLARRRCVLFLLCLRFARGPQSFWCLYSPIPAT